MILGAHAYRTRGVVGDTLLAIRFTAPVHACRVPYAHLLPQRREFAGMLSMCGDFDIICCAVTVL